MYLALKRYNTEHFILQTTLFNYLQVPMGLGNTIPAV